MNKPRKTVKAALPLANLRASLGRMQAEGERMLVRARREAEMFVRRNRGEVAREVRSLERRVLKGLHVATEQKVARLERRIANLEATVAGMRAAAGTGERAA